MSWGPLIFGHADPETVAAVRRGGRATARRFGAPTEARGRARRRDRRRGAVGREGAARLLGHRGGDERDPARARRSRAATGSSSSPAATTATPTRCSPSAGSGLATLGIPSSPGVPTRRGAGHDRLPVQRRRRGRGRRRAATARASRAIIVEPVAGNMGVVPPEPGFLEALRALCDASGALLVFDEVITGLPRRPRRRAGALRRHARPDDPRQDRRRRPAARGVRRARRRDGPARAGGRRLPGGHALREPARDRGRALGAAPPARPGRLRASSRPRRARLEAGLAPFGRVQRVGAMLTLFMRDAPVRELRRRAGVRHRALRRALPPPARAGRLRRAVAVRGDVRLDRARRRRDRPDGGGGWRASSR